jgi:hypothetical protein
MYTKQLPIVRKVTQSGHPGSTAVAQQITPHEKNSETKKRRSEKEISNDQKRCKLSSRYVRSFQCDQIRL